MPSTYTTNLGIQKPANGELSGSWGQAVNANSDILDNAINGVIGLTLSGTASTLTTANGEPSNGQYKVLVLGGSPSGTHTVTIDPSTAHKVYFVNNTTAQSVVFTQGSGGNVTIAAGTTAVIYSNGAGATAAVTKITDALGMSAAKITGGTITGITDLALVDGGTGASTAADARTNLGLGTMATQASSSVAITGGSIAGITDLAIADGGTGASTAADALVNLGLTATAAELNIMDGVTATTAELNILDGVVATTAEINYLDGVTSPLQTQLNSKAPLASPTFTGTPVAPTATSGTNTTQVATTAFVAVVASQALGVGQTWQNAGKTFGITYTNTTGRPIQVSVYAYAGNTTVDLQLWVGGVMVQRFIGNPDSSDIAYTVSAIVPNGVSYYAAQAGFYTHQWNELR